MGRIAKHSSKGGGGPLAKHIGNRLLLLRQRQIVTMRQVGDGSGLSNAFVCQVENGQSCPTAETLWKLATYFQVPVGYFFEGYAPVRENDAPDG